MKRREYVFEMVKNNLKKGVDEGLYRDDQNIDLVASLYVKKLEDMHDPEFLTSQNFSFDTVFRVMFDNHIRGISNQKGIEYYEKKKKSLNINF